MKRTPHLLALLLLVAAAAPAGAQQVPIVLRQDLGQAIGSVSVRGLHDVAVMADTADYIAVVTQGTVAQADSLRRPLESMKLSNGTLTIPADFPYVRGINVHTTAQRLHIEARENSQVWLTGASGDDGDTLRFAFLRIEAVGHSGIQSPRPVAADQAILEADDYATVRYRDVASADVTRKVRGESRVQQMGVDDQEEAYRLNLSPKIHRYFASWAFGTSGWSQSPFGGMAAPMGDYAMSTGGAGIPYLQYGAYNISIGINLIRLRHWDFGIGIATYGEEYCFPRLMGTSVDAATGLTHLGPVDEPDYYTGPEYAGQECVWRSRLPMSYIQFPIRVEWHRRLDYRGLRLSAELRPGISNTGRQTGLIDECTWTSGSEADRGRVGQLASPIKDLAKAFRCDLRLDIGFGRLSVFVQGALTPLFRTTLKDDLPALDTKVYPLVMGFSLNY